MSRPRRVRLRELASEADLDLDEALVTLWDSGLDHFDTTDDFVATRDLAAVRQALGLSNGREQLTVEYWLQATGLSRVDLTERLNDLGIRLKPDVRRIPKGSLRKVRSLIRVPLPPAPARATPADVPPLRWEVVGHEQELSHLNYDEVLAIHERLEEDFAGSLDPIEPPGVRDDGLLQSAVFRAHTSLGETRKYPTIPMAAAAMFHSIAQNHAFHNGNKRTALVALLAFLDRNGRVLTCTEQDLFRFTLRTAQHRLVPIAADALADREVLEAAHWIQSNSRPIDREERPMKWIRLKKRLRDFGCELEISAGVGNRLNVSRVVEQRGRLRRSRLRTLRCQVACAGDGTEAERNTVHLIRRQLELDDEHDVDSATFYRGEEVDSFIVEYRRILDRLAKL